MELPPELAEAGPPPGASWFAKLRAYLRSCRVTVARGSGLTARAGPGGTAIALDRGALPRFAISTGTISAYTPGTKKLGEGPAAIHRIQKTAAGHFLVPVGGPSVTVLNADVGSPSGTGIVSGRVLQLKVVDNVLVIDVDYCGTP